MYDPKVGQFLSEDPIKFDGLDENLRRYVRNRVTDRTDPSGLLPVDDIFGLPSDAWTTPVPVTGGSEDIVAPSGPVNDIQEIPLDQLTQIVPMTPLFVYTNTINLSTIGAPATVIGNAINDANELFDPAGIVLIDNGLLESPTTKDRVAFDQTSETFVGGPFDGKNPADVLAATSSNPSILPIICVDEILRPFGYGSTYRLGSGKAPVVIVAVKIPPHKNADSLGRTVAHECGHFFNLGHRPADAVDPENLMAWGAWFPGGIARGGILNANEIRRLREAVLRW